jgi:hypothetical protein
VSTFRVPRGWHVALYQPEAPPADGCQPTVLCRYPRVRSHTAAYEGTIYRGACFGCRWTSPIQDGENQATEDAHDHAFPGWRALTPIEPYRYDDFGKRSRLAKELLPLFPPHWRDRCGPTVTYRNHSYAVRHVPGGGLFGGYCMARLRAHGERGADGGQQLDLFAE